VRWCARREGRSSTCVGATVASLSTDDDDDDASVRSESSSRGAGASTASGYAFDRIVSAADANARLAPDEDALAILSPHDATDVVALRRVLARYSRSRTIVIVNPRFETDPGEMDGAVLVYGMLPLVAASRNAEADAGGGGGRGGSGAGSGLRAVVMYKFALLRVYPTVRLGRIRGAMATMPRLHQGIPPADVWVN
jgi:hypothetical protein